MLYETLPSAITGRSYTERAHWVKGRVELLVEAVALNRVSVIKITEGWEMDRCQLALDFYQLPYDG
jgi:hypothetical protein